MSDFNSPKNTLPDLMPLEDDRSSEVLPQELDAIRMSLMETSWRTKQIVDVLIRHNSLLERDIEKITNLKRRLRRSIGIIPGMPGRAGALFGVGVTAGFLPMGGDGTKLAQPFIFPPRVRGTKPPRSQKDPVRVKDPIRVTEDVRVDVKEDVRVRVPEGETIRVPEGQTDQGIITDTSKVPTNEQISGTEVQAGIAAGTDVITKILTQPEAPTNEEISGTIQGVLEGITAGSRVPAYPHAGEIKPYNPTFIEQIGNVFNSWFADRNRRNKWLKSPEYKILQLELAKMNVSDVDINWGAIFDWTVAIGAVAFPGDAVFGDLAAVANLLMKGRITWGLLARAFGKKGVEKLYNYFMQNGIQVPQWNFSSIKPNSSSFNIASASDTVNSDGLHSHTRKKDVFVFITDKPPIA